MRKQNLLIRKIKMKRTGILLFILVALCSFSAYSQQLQPLSMDTSIRYGKLPNGLTYYIRHNEQPKDRAEFFIAQKVGAILEEDSQNGLAHFLEHMAFNGTKNFPGKNLINYFETIGVRFGYNINAGTSLDQTVYNLSEVPTTREGIIDSALLVLHDWSSFILLDDTEIDKERGVILEEWRQGMDANRRLWKESNAVLFEGSQYAKRDIIGDTAVIKHFSHQTLRDYYKKWYRPDLQAIFIVGDINVDKIESKIKAVFADIPAPVNPAERIYYPVPDKKDPITGIFTDPEMQAANISLDFRFDAFPDAVKLSMQGYAISIVDNLINNMMNDRFSEILQEPGSPFSSANGYVTSATRTKDAFSFSVNPVLGKEKEARERLLKEAESVRRFGFTTTELERAKTELISSYEKMYNERNQQKNNRLVREYTRNFLSAEGIPGIAWEFNFVKNILPNLQVNSVNQIAQKYLNSTGIAYVVFGPEKEGLVYPTKEELAQELSNVKSVEMTPYKDSVSTEPLISSKIKAGKIKKSVAGKVEGTTEWTLSNGIKVILKPTKFKDDEIRMTAWSDGGYSLVSLEDLPSAMLATSVISQSGLGTFTLPELKKKLAGKIANVSTGIRQYEESLNGSSSVKDFETMLQLLYLNFYPPREDKNVYDMVMKSNRTWLENAALDPQNAYSDSINAIIMQHHPRILPGNLELLDKVNYPALLKVYKERFANPADFTFLFVGNLNPDSIKPMVAKYIGGLKTTKSRESWKDNGLYYAKGPVYREIEKKLKISKTSNYIQYSANIPYNLENSLAFTTLGNILRIRYTATIREEEGASYGVSANGQINQKPKPSGYLTMYFDTDPKVYKKMLGIIHGEIDSIAKNGPDPEILNKVKLNLIKQYNENIQENAWWQQAISSEYRDGIDIVNGYEKLVDSITSETIKATAKDLIGQNNIAEILLMPEE
jgi:zinc protease